MKKKRSKEPSDADSKTFQQLNAILAEKTKSELELREKLAGAMGLSERQLYALVAMHALVGRYGVSPGTAANAFALADEMCTESAKRNANG